MTATALVPIGFVAFCADVLHVELTPGQLVLCRVAFDGVDPCDLSTEAERDLARLLFGDVDRIPALAREVIAAMCGARAGKSYVLGALRLLHLALTVDLHSLAPGEVAAGVIVAPDLRLGRQVFRYLRGAVESVPTIEALVVAETSESVTLLRPDGCTVEIVCLPATRGGSALRGRSLIGAVLDECAFFRDSDFQVNDAELFKAVAPRIVPGGQAILASTPWLEAGLLFDLFVANHGHPTTCLAVHAPTVLLRGDERTRQLVERERERDPDNAAREFDAEPMGAGAGVFFDPAAIKAAVVELSEAA
jgi:hypothetical protein